MRTIGALVFPEFEVLDLYGPLEMFGMFEDEFEIRIVAETAAPVRSAQGPRTMPDDILGARDYDILIIPGGRGTRRDVENPAIISWLADAHENAELTTSICTGAALLAKAGILDGRAATTNKLAFDWVTDFGPKTTWQRAARWVEDGNVFTASGVSAGTDMALAALERLLGPKAPIRASFYAEYTANRDPTNDPFAAPEKKSK